MGHNKCLFLAFWHHLAHNIWFLSIRLAYIRQLSMLMTCNKPRSHKESEQEREKSVKSNMNGINNNNNIRPNVKTFLWANKKRKINSKLFFFSLLFAFWVYHMSLKLLLAAAEMVKIKKRTFYFFFFQSCALKRVWIYMTMIIAIIPIYLCFTLDYTYTHSPRMAKRELF